MPLPGMPAWTPNYLADANMVAESLERRNQNWEFSPGKKNDTVGFRSSDYILEIRLMITAGNLLVRIQL